MFMRLFRSLMPKEEGFIEHFVAHSGRIVAAADVLTALMAADQKDRSARFAELTAIEKEADAISRRTIVAVHRAFITPFDRSDIHALSNALDDTVDLIEEVAQAADLYRIDSFSPYMRDLGKLIQDAARLIVELTPLLTNISGNAPQIVTLCERVSKIESAADDVLLKAMSDLIAEKPDTIDFLGRKEVYELLEAVTDRCDDVADVIEGIVLDHV